MPTDLPPRDAYIEDLAEMPEMPELDALEMNDWSHDPMSVASVLSVFILSGAVIGALLGLLI